nr:hypothetical protein Iba_chr02bCG20860 [Ipomoea batatas]
MWNDSLVKKKGGKLLEGEVLDHFCKLLAYLSRRALSVMNQQAKMLCCRPPPL